MTELGEAREGIAEGDDRVALGLVHLAQEQAGRELPAHLRAERVEADRPFLLRRDRPGRNEVGLAEVLEQTRGRPDDGMIRRRGIADHGARLAIVVEPPADLRRERLTLGKRKFPAVEVEPPADVGAQRTEGHLREERPAQEGRHEEEVDDVVLVEVEVEPLARGDVQDDAAAVEQALDEPTGLEPAEALVKIQLLVALERGGEAHPARPQQRDQGMRGGQELGHAAAGPRRTEERTRAHRGRAGDRGLVHLA